MSEQSGGMRASDTDRNQMAEFLQDAMARGYITADELSERTAKALDAKTMGELAGLVDDLPAPPGFAAPAAASAAGPAAGPADGAGQAADEVVLRGQFGGVKRTGHWRVPANLRLQGRFCSFQLDLTEADITARTVTVEIDTTGGSVEMRLPDGATASLDDLDVRMGSVEDHRRNPPREGALHVRFTGTVRLGSVEVRGPRKRLFGR